MTTQAEPDQAPAEPTPETTRTRRLALIEVLDRDGRALRAVDVLHWPFTIGRALDQDLVLDDPFVAPAHLRLQPDSAGRLLLSVGDTRNGIQIGSQQHSAGQTIAISGPASALHLGQTRLMLRRPDPALAPERALPQTRLMRKGSTLAAALALFGLLLLSHWVALDPGADAKAWLPALIGTPGAIVAWCALWALMSKLFQHRFEFLAHLRVALPWLLALEVVDMLWPQIAAALGWSAMWRLGPPLQVLLLALMVRQHLLLLVPLQRHRVSLALAGAVLAGSAISLAFVHDETDRFSRAPYMSTLPTPALSLEPAQPPQALIDTMSALSQRLQARARQARARDDDSAEDAASD